MFNTWQEPTVQQPMHMLVVGKLVQRKILYPPPRPYVHSLIKVILLDHY